MEILRSFRGLPACRRLLFPLFVVPRATKEIGDVCTQAISRGNYWWREMSTV